MKNPLLRYRVLIQYLEEVQDGLPNRATFDKTYDTYKKAKKESLKVLQGIQLVDKRILRATIEPVLLQENLV